MLEELLPYYERELGYLRQMAGEFAARFPKIGRRLQIDGDQCEDPHVERLIEAFAFLAARIHRKLDDEYPEITEAFIQVLYPHYMRPIPSATILQLIHGPREAGDRGTVSDSKAPGGVLAGGPGCEVPVPHVLRHRPVARHPHRRQAGAHPELGIPADAHLRRKPSSPWSSPRRAI